MAKKNFNPLMKDLADSPMPARSALAKRKTRKSKKSPYGLMEDIVRGKKVPRGLMEDIVKGKSKRKKR